MAHLTIFREGFLSSLKNSVASNLEKYRQDADWVSRVGTRDGRELDTRVELRTTLALCDPEDKDLKDLENAIRIHKSLSSLTPLQARDPRIWTRLAHCECWSYMRQRWPVERWEKEGSDSVVGRVIERYFVARNESRALLRNGISRLWWIAQLSCDHSRDNPYELTAVLVRSLDITQTILERSMGRGHQILHGFLEFLMLHRTEVLTGGDKNRFRIRDLAKFLNMYGGVCLLDSLTETEIIELLSKEFERILRLEAGPSKTKPAPVTI